MIATYCLADRTIQIDSDNERLHKMCRDYRVDGRDHADAVAHPDGMDPASGPAYADGPDRLDPPQSMPGFTVRVSPEDIASERERAAREALAEGRQPRSSSDAYLEALVVYRKIAERMPAFDTVLFHGSAVAVDGAAYLFIAKSGTGKSTHARLWRELLGESAVMVNDDKPLVRIADNGATVYGTPWDGKHHLSSNIAVPLKAVCVLERADENRIAPITASDALSSVLRQCYRPADPEALVKTMSLVDSLMSNVALYRMGCTADCDAARMAYEAMR